MKNIRVLRQAFVRQVDENDCGLACLSMILLLAGKESEIHKIRNQIFVPKSGVSLLELKKLAIEQQLKAKCVHLDISFLRENNTPSILLMMDEQNNHHYQVCFGVSKKRQRYYYLMADPAGTVYKLEECELLKAWPGQTALFFDDFEVTKPSFLKSSIYTFLTLNIYPKMLWVTVAILNICAASLGISISWLLQRLVEGTEITAKTQLICSIVLLLFFITLFRCFVTYLKQQIFVLLTGKVQSKLVTVYVNKLLHNSAYTKQSLSERTIANGMAEIQKIQHGNYMFLSAILCDGCLLLLILAILLYLNAFAGMVTLTYLALVVTINIVILPQLQFDQKRINALSGNSENLLREELFGKSGSDHAEITLNSYKFYEENYKRYFHSYKSLANKINKINLLQECLGVATTIGILFYNLLKLNGQKTNVSSVLIIVVLTYFITSIMPKITNALFVVIEGAESSKQFINNVHNNS